MLLCQVAYGQVAVGPLVGLNISNYNAEDNGIKTDSRVKLGGRIGVLFEIPLSCNLYVQPGLNYVTNGYGESLKSGGDVLYIVNTIELPANLEYKIPVNYHKNAFFFGGGPVVGWNKGGIVHVKDDKSRIDSRRDIYIGEAISDDIKRWDVGVGVNVGFEYTNNLLFRVHYQHGFLNLKPVGDDNNSIRNYNMGLSVGYLFHSHHDKYKHKRKTKEEKRKEKEKRKTEHDKEKRKNYQ
jgi:hypothetical protein